MASNVDLHVLEISNVPEPLFHITDKSVSCAVSFNMSANVLYGKALVQSREKSVRNGLSAIN